MKVNLADIIKGVNDFNALAPLATGLILAIRKPDGTETVLATLANDKAQADENVAGWEAFLAELKAEQEAGK